MIEKYIFFRC